MHGFALVELMVGVCLLVILVSISMMGLRMVHTLNAWLEVEKLYLTCRTAQCTARSSQVSQKIDLDRTANSYRYHNQQHKLEPAASYGVLNGIKGPPSSPAHFVNNVITFAQNSMVFTKDGTMSSGTVYLVDRNRSVQYALTSGVGHTGYVRLYRYRDNWHCMNE